MSRQAVIFGAGNIGRGFIGQLFVESGYRVTFVDIDRELIDALNRDGFYRLQTVFNQDVRERRIANVCAVHGAEAAAVEAAVAEAEIGATAVGAGVLGRIAPHLARGIGRRAANARPLNLLVCENLKGAAAVLRDMVAAETAPEKRAELARAVGFVDTVIGRMVPMPTPEMRAADIGLIRVEPYKELPVDRAGFVGEIPRIVAMTPEENFPVFTARKLYIHNCGHALLAYLGYLRGHRFGYEALADPEVHRVLAGGLAESIAGIVARHGVEEAWLQAHVRDLLERFANRALGDTIFRLGRDPLRKLAADDRLTGAARLCHDAAGRHPMHLAWGIAAGLLFDPEEDQAAHALQAGIKERGIAAVLTEVTGVESASPVGSLVLEAYRILATEPRAPFKRLDDLR